MSDIAIEELTKMFIEEHFKKEKNKYVMTKEQLIKFCIKLEKVIKKVEDDYEDAEIRNNRLFKNEGRNT